MRTVECCFDLRVPRARQFLGQMKVQMPIMPFVRATEVKNQVLKRVALFHSDPFLICG